MAKPTNPALQTSLGIYGLCENKSMFKSNYGTIGGGIDFGGKSIYTVNGNQKKLFCVGGGFKGVYGSAFSTQGTSTSTCDGGGDVHAQVYAGRVFSLGNNDSDAITVAADAQVDFSGYDYNNKSYTQLNFGAGVNTQWTHAWEKCALYVGNTTNAIFGTEDFKHDLKPGIFSHSVVGFRYQKPDEDFSMEFEGFHEVQKFKGLPEQHVAGITAKFGVDFNWGLSNVAKKSNGSKFKKKSTTGTTGGASSIGTTGGASTTGTNGVGGNSLIYITKEMPTGEVKYGRNVGVRKDIVKDEQSGLYIAILEDGTKITYKEQDPEKKAKIYKTNKGTIVFQNMSDVQILGKKDNIGKYKFDHCTNVEQNIQKNNTPDPTGGISYSNINIKKDIVKDEQSGLYTVVLEDGTKVTYKEQDPNKKARIYETDAGKIVFENMSDVTIVGNEHKTNVYYFMDCENVTVDVSASEHKNDQDFVTVRSSNHKSLKEMNIVIKKDEEDNVKKVGTNKEGTRENGSVDPQATWATSPLPITDEDDSNNIIVVAKKEK